MNEWCGGNNYVFEISSCIELLLVLICLLFLDSAIFMEMEKLLLPSRRLQPLEAGA